MDVSPITLEGQHVRLEPLSQAHAKTLVAAASDGELWKTTVTIIPDSDGIASYIDAALAGLSLGKELPFVIINKSSNEVVGTTRFYEIRVFRQSARRNTRSKLLALRARCGRGRPRSQQ